MFYGHKRDDDNDNVMMIRAKKFNSLQRAIWVKTRKQQKWFWGDIIACWIPDSPLQD